MALAKTPGEVGRGPIFLIPLESRLARGLALILVLGLAAALASVIVRPAVAAYLASHARSVADLERALAWDPRNPALHLRIARVAERIPDADKAHAHFETARRLRPTDAYPWLGLALLAQRTGELAEARRAFDTALALDPHNVHIRWEAALSAFRLGQRERALEHFRYVLAVDPGQRDAAFQLARLLLKPGEDPGALLPEEPDGLTNVLLTAVRNEDPALAKAAWTRRAALEPRLPKDVGRRYLDFLLQAGDGTAARQVWPLLVPPDGQADGNAVWNGGFETERLLGWGLDWRVGRVWGVDVALDRFVAATGRRSLRLTFNSFPTLDFAGVSQLVAVEPGRTYELRALAKATEFTTRSGLKLEVVRPGTDGRLLAETATISGTMPGWLPLEARVSIPTDVTLALLRVRREPAREPEGNLGGRVWLDEVTLK